MVPANSRFDTFIDDDGLPALADFVADGGLDLEFAARLEAEGDVVA